MKYLGSPVAIATLFLFSVTNISAQSTQADRPVLKPGSEWSYRTDNSRRDNPGPPGELKRTIKEVGSNEYTIELSTNTTPARTGAMSLDLNPFNEDMSFASRATGSIPYFLFPFVVSTLKCNSDQDA